MGIGTPFHSRTSALCKSLKWKEWAGYFSVVSYETTHDREYIALRQAAGLLDISPLYKYRISGPGAGAMLDRLVARRMDNVGVGRVVYACWCDERGRVLDDGTIHRLEENVYRVTSASPSGRWLGTVAWGFDVGIEDESTAVAALALQGPTSRDTLKQVTAADLDRLAYFRLTPARIGSLPVTISRTGYTGDLGYEIWVDAADAEGLWDVLMAGGREYGITPLGLQALDVARIEAGYVLIDVDYVSARRALTEEQAASPFEIGLGWTVHLGKEDFIGRRALLAEERRGPRRLLVGLEIDERELRGHHDRAGIPPDFPLVPWRQVIPLFRGDRQAGWATSGCWSPTLKKYIALASVRPECAEPGTALRIDLLVQFQRKGVGARVVERPFFDPPRKRA
ncbi:MAG: aminomethyl transferase family protein [Acidobacteria bacterium]|nr:aminomethyl transferase family protein [Acidobacteriota bacterium]